MNPEDLKDRYIVAGKKSVLEYLEQAPAKVDLVLLQKDRQKELHVLCAKCKAKGLKFQFVDRAVLDKAAENLKHQGVLARIFEAGFSSPEEILVKIKKSTLPVILALDQVQDAGNLGVLARTLLALGGCGLVLPKNRTAAPGLRAEKSAAGALSRLPVARVTNLAKFLADCQGQNLGIYYAGTDAGCQELYRTSLILPAVLVLGNEQKGVRPGVKKQCSRGVKIPMPGEFESLNVAQAGAIILGEFLRRSLM